MHDATGLGYAYASLLEKLKNTSRHLLEAMEAGTT